MKQIKRQRIYIRFIVVFCLFLLLLLAGFQSIWVLAGAGTPIMLQTGLQRTRVQSIAKNALILASRPEEEHTQAVSELQNILPRFEQAQVGLNKGDTSLQLPSHVPDDIAALVVASQSDYGAIDTATRKLLVTADGHVDLLQVDIVITHERDYSLEMTAVASAWQSHIENAFLQIFAWEMGIVFLLLVLVLVQYILITRHMMTTLLKEAKEREEHAV